MIGALLTTPAQALTCNIACTECFGTLITQCTKCVLSTHILQNYECILIATGCSAGYKLDSTDGICKPWLCNGNTGTTGTAITDEFCEECYDNGTNAPASCTKCIAPKMLQDYQCKDACDTGYTMDANDRICKKTIYDVDNPCKPGAVNI